MLSGRAGAAAAGFVPVEEELDPVDRAKDSSGGSWWVRGGVLKRSWPVFFGWWMGRRGMAA